jgi:hypothetical protein
VKDSKYKPLLTECNFPDKSSSLSKRHYTKDSLYYRYCVEYISVCRLLDPCLLRSLEHTLCKSQRQSNLHTLVSSLIRYLFAYYKISRLENFILKSKALLANRRVLNKLNIPQRLSSCKTDNLIGKNCLSLDGNY